MILLVISFAFSSICLIAVSNVCSILSMCSKMAFVMRSSDCSMADVICCVNIIFMFSISLVKAA